MPLKFTSFVNYNNIEIALYVMVNTYDPTSMSLAVYLKDIKSPDMICLRLENSKWGIVPQEIPLWVKEFQPHLVNLIEREANINVELARI